MLSTPWIQSLLLQLGFQETDPEKPRRKPCMPRSVPILRQALWKLLPNHLARQRISSRLKARDNQGICPWSPEWYIPLLQAWICDRASTRSDDVAWSSPHFHPLWSLSVEVLQSLQCKVYMCCFTMQHAYAYATILNHTHQTKHHSILDDNQHERNSMTVWSERRQERGDENILQQKMMMKDEW